MHVEKTKDPVNALRHPFVRYRVHTAVGNINQQGIHAMFCQGFGKIANATKNTEEAAALQPSAQRWYGVAASNPELLEFSSDPRSAADRKYWENFSRTRSPAASTSSPISRAIFCILAGFS